MSPFKPFVFCLALVLSADPLPAQTAIPEPPVVVCGQVAPASPAPDLTGVSFTLAGNGETLTTATPARVVTIDSVSWYIVSIPFESRAVQGGAALTATPGALALTAADTTYSITAKVGAATATLPAGQTTLVYGAQRQGFVARLDLTLGGETYAQWSQRVFGSLASQTADADGDGRSNYEEFLAGTDPQNANSRLTVRGFTPLPGGGLTLTWDSVPGKAYRVERSTSLTSGPWSILQNNVPGDGTAKSFTDTHPGPSARVFYRIAVLPPD